MTFPILFFCWALYALGVPSGNFPQFVPCLSPFRKPNTKQEFTRREEITWWKSQVVLGAGVGLISFFFFSFPLWIEFQNSFVYVLKNNKILSFATKIDNISFFILTFWNSYSKSTKINSMTKCWIFNETFNQTTLLLEFNPASFQFPVSTDTEKNYRQFWDVSYLVRTFWQQPKKVYQNSVHWEVIYERVK